MEGDTLEVVEHPRRNEAWWENCGSVTGDAKQLLNGFMEWRVEHISRNANEVEHRLAKLALSLQGEHLWVANYPSCIQPYVLAEQIFD